MTTSRKSLLLAAAAFLALAISGAGTAEGLKAGGMQPPQSAAERAAREGMSLSEAVQRAKQAFPGRVLRAETTEKGGRREHVIRILNDEGRVRTLRYDANTGRRL